MVSEFDKRLSHIVENDAIDWLKNDGQVDVGNIYYEMEDKEALKEILLDILDEVARLREYIDLIDGGCMNTCQECGSDRLVSLGDEVGCFECGEIYEEVSDE